MNKWRLLFGSTPNDLSNEILATQFYPGFETTMIECEKAKIPYILLSRKEGNNWEEQASWAGGDELYWESILD